MSQQICLNCLQSSGEICYSLDGLWDDGGFSLNLLPSAVLRVTLNYLSSTWRVLILLQTSEAEKTLITEYIGKHKNPKQSLK